MWLSRWPGRLTAVAAAVAGVAELAGDAQRGGWAWMADRGAATLHTDGGRWHEFFTVLALPAQRWLVVSASGVLLLWRWRQRRLAGRVFLAIGGGYIALTALTLVLKVHFGRLAPHAFEAWHAGGMSFPSGHAVNAGFLWASVGLLPGLRRRWQILALTMALLPPIAMVALGYHWLSDIVAGWLVAGAALVTVRGLMITGEPTGNPPIPIHEPAGGVDGEVRNGIAGLTETKLTMFRARRYLHRSVRIP